MQLNKTNSISIIFANCIIFFSLNIFSQKNIDLHVVNSEGTPFLLTLDGKLINNSPQANVEIKNLDSKEYQSIITFPESGTNFKGKIYTIWEGTPTDNREFTYTIDKSGNNNWRIRFLSSSPLEFKKESISHNKDSTSCMNENDFNKNLSVINFQSFEDSRLHKSEELFLKSCLSLSQIVQVCEVFEYDQSKFSFIKFSYENSKEKKEFKKLDKVFNYRNTKNEFLKWLSDLEMKK
jgi:hypothetical protein